MWAGGAAITFVVRLRGGGVETTVATAMAERVCNALVSTWRYVAQTVWPAGLAPFYPPVHRADVAGALAALARLAAVTVLLLRRGRPPELAVGWLWYLGMLV